MECALYFLRWNFESTWGHVIFASTKSFVKTDDILESKLLKTSGVNIIMWAGFIQGMNPIKQLWKVLVILKITLIPAWPHTYNFSKRNYSILDYSQFFICLHIPEIFGVCLFIAGTLQILGKESPVMIINEVIESYRRESTKEMITIQLQTFKRLVCWQILIILILEKEK